MQWRGSHLQVAAADYLIDESIVGASKWFQSGIAAESEGSWHMTSSQTFSNAFPRPSCSELTGPDGVEWIHFDRILRRWTGRQNNRLTKCNCDRLRGLGIEEQDIWPQYHSIPNTIQNPKQKSEPPWIAGHNRMKVLTMNSQSQPGLKNTFVAGNLQKLISKRETNQGPSISPTVDESARVWTSMYITLVCENENPYASLLSKYVVMLVAAKPGWGMSNYEHFKNMQSASKKQKALRRWCTSLHSQHSSRWPADLAGPQHLSRFVGRESQCKQGTVCDSYSCQLLCR